MVGNGEMVGELVGFVRSISGTLEDALTYVPVQSSTENPQHLLYDNTYKGVRMPGPGSILRTAEGLIYLSHNTPPVVLYLSGGPSGAK